MLPDHVGNNVYLYAEVKTNYVMGMENGLFQMLSNSQKSKNPNKEITEYKINDGCQRLKIGVSREEF